MSLSHRNHSIDLLANQLTGFYVRGTLTVKGLNLPETLKTKKTLEKGINERFCKLGSYSKFLLADIKFHNSLYNYKLSNQIIV